MGRFNPFSLTPNLQQMNLKKHIGKHIKHLFQWLYTYWRLLKWLWQKEDLLIKSSQKACLTFSTIVKLHISSTACSSLFRVFIVSVLRKVVHWHSSVDPIITCWYHTGSNNGHTFWRNSIFPSLPLGMAMFLASHVL